MPRIIVRRHGDRYALLDNPDRAPVAEYRTRQLAEVAAYHRAGEGGEVVWEEDTGDEQLGAGAVGDEESGTGSGASGTDRRTGGAGSPREPQAGL